MPLWRRAIEAPHVKHAGIDLYRDHVGMDLCPPKTSYISYGIWYVLVEGVPMCFQMFSCMAPHFPGPNLENLQDFLKPG